MLPQPLVDKIKEIYAVNAFMHLCDLELASIDKGEACVELRINDLKHTNTHHLLHGGLITTMMDNATGFAGASIGKRVVTVSMTVDFIKTAGPGSLLQATARVVRLEGNKVYMDMKVVNKDTGDVLAVGTSVMFSVKDIPGFPQEDGE